MNNATGGASPNAGGVKASSGAYPLLALLTLVYVFNSIDRHVISVLAEPIRTDLGLSDTQLGMLTGLIFALFYTFFGIPAGWLADRFGRVVVIGWACVLWSVFSVLGGFSQNFAQLAMARMGVGVGEAGGSAPSYSLISSRFPPSQRGHAIGVYHLASPLSTMVGGALCGWIAANYGWRAALIAVSAPGILIGIGMLIAVREPKPAADAPPLEPTPPLLPAIVAYFRNPITRVAAIAAGLSSFTSFAIANWLPAFLMRVKGMELEAMGYYGVAYAIPFAFGLWFGGWLADRVVRRTAGAYALVPCLALLTTIPFFIAAILAPGWMLTLALFIVPVATCAMFLAPGVTLIQNISAPNQRALSGALFLFVNNLVGAGFGPLYTGMISDWAKPQFGDQSLTVGLLACIPVLLIAASVQFWLFRRLKRDAAGLA